MLAVVLLFIPYTYICSQKEFGLFNCNIEDLGPADSVSIVTLFVQIFSRDAIFFIICVMSVAEINDKGLELKNELDEAMCRKPTNLPNAAVARNGEDMHVLQQQQQQIQDLTICAAIADDTQLDHNIRTPRRTYAAISNAFDDAGLSDEEDSSFSWPTDCGCCGKFPSCWVCCTSTTHDPNAEKEKIEIESLPEISPDELKELFNAVTGSPIAYEVPVLGTVTSKRLYATIIAFTFSAVTGLLYAFNTYHNTH